MLEAVLAGKLGERVYMFDPHWAPGEELASWANGGGDEYSVVFSAAGAFVRGFDHESATTPWRSTPLTLWPGLVDGLPDVFRRYVTEPAFAYDGVLQASVCLWRQAGDDGWHTGNVAFPAGDHDPDGAEWMFQYLVEDSSAEDYHESTEELVGRAVSLAAVQHVYALRPLTEDVVRGLNPELSLDDTREYVAEIGYPDSPPTP
jgi:hypothetical protein